jgi:hypothetical protein
MQKMVCKFSSSLCEKFIPSQPEIRISRMHVEAAKCNLANSKMQPCKQQNDARKH